MVRILLIVLCMTMHSQALAAKSGDDAIGRILREKGLVARQGVHIVRLSDGFTLYESDADLLLTPASVTKVLTTAAVLKRFTPVHTFKTRMLYTGSNTDGKIAGDLIVAGDGDPFLVSEKLWQMAADLKNMGITQFSGDLVLDNSLFDGEARDENRRFGEKATRNAYDAPVTALGVNFNTFAVAVAPGEPGQPAHVGLDPYPLRGVTIENNVRTSKRGTNRAIEVNRLTDPKKGERIVVSGTIPAGAPIYKVYRSVSDHLQATGEYFKAFLRHAGISVTGQIRSGAVPAGAKELLEIESYDLRKLTAGLNTFSNNYIADVLTKRLGAAFPRSGKADAQGQGNFSNGVAAIRSFLENDVGIKTKFALNDGSGLSPENKLSARQVTQVLSYMEKHMELFPEFLGSFPATGWDGTLRKRFSRGDAAELKGQFRAKTGTLTVPVSVAGLAGYFRHPKHGLVGFAIIENGISGKVQPSIADLRDRQDNVLAALMQEL